MSVFRLWEPIRILLMGWQSFVEMLSVRTSRLLQKMGRGYAQPTGADVRARETEEKKVMAEWVVQHYLILKALHLVAVMSWMAGMLYLPRLFVYHTSAAVGSEASEMLKVMERRLLRFIINPAMIATFILGSLLAMLPETMHMGWFHAKLGLLFFMFGFHGMCARWRKDFAADRNQRPAKFYRMMNEVPTVLMVGIVLLAVLKPF